MHWLNNTHFFTQLMTALCLSLYPFICLPPHISSPQLLCLLLGLSPGSLWHQLLHDLLKRLVSRPFSHHPHPYLPIRAQEPLYAPFATCRKTWSPELHLQPKLTHLSPQIHSPVVQISHLHPNTCTPKLPAAQNNSPADQDSNEKCILFLHVCLISEIITHW